MARIEDDATDARPVAPGDRAMGDATSRDDGSVRHVRTVRAGEGRDEHAPDAETAGDAVGGRRERVTRLPSLSSLKGMDVRDGGGDKVGTVRDVFLDPRAEHVRYLSVSTGWLSRGTHVVPIDEVSYVDDMHDEPYAVVPYSTEALKGAPSLDEDGEVTPEREREIRGYYDGVGRWEETRDAVRARQSTPAPTPEIARAQVADEMGRDTTRTEERGR